MKKTSITRIIRVLSAAAIAIGLAVSAHAQGITTAAMTGLVTDKNGSPVAGATVTATHDPSGTKLTTTTRANGRFDLSGLRIGGPFTVTATTRDGATDERKDYYLAAGDVMNVDFALAPSDIVQMEKFAVTASRDAIFDAGRVGAATTFTSSDIQRAVAPRNSVQDIANLDSRITLNSLDQGGNMSAQGQNFRFNSFLIDGVENNDPYGLNGNGFPSLRGPVSLDAVQSMTVELDPIDMRRSGFTGALVNVVLKSGGNDFSGSVGYEWAGNSLPLGNLRTTGMGDPKSNKYPAKVIFDERTFSFTFGGPIIRNKLFFFLSYEDYRRTSLPPAQGFLLNGTSKALDGSMKPTMDVVQQIMDVAKDLYNYDLGTFNAATVATQKNYSAKIDWNITDKHRASFTYNRTDGNTPNFAGFTSYTGISPSNYWFQQPRVMDSYGVQLNSTWTDNFRTEATISYKSYDGSPKNNGAPFPSVGIGGMGGTRLDTNASANGYLNFGTEYSRQLNNITTKEWLGKLNGEYSIGQHTLLAGIEDDSTHYNNRFVQAFYGSYSFASVAMFEARTPYSYTSTKLNPGYTMDDLFADWIYTNLSAYVQDTWKPSTQLTVIGGVRIDYPQANKSPVFNQSFYDGFGIRNDGTVNGNYLVSPRLGFTFTPDKEKQIQFRGGVGLYQGRSPAVWMSNAYQNAGAASTVTTSVSSSTVLPDIIFNHDVTNQPDNPATAGGARMTMNLTDPNFMMPSVWKGNIAVDVKLPFQGMIFTAELGGTKTNKGLFVKFLNYQLATDGGPITMPDGRDRYAGNITPAYTDPNRPAFPSYNSNGRIRVAGFGDVYELTNTNKGASSDFTLSLTRPMRNNWSAGIAWTRNNATEVSPMTSSTAGSLYNTRAVYNPNEDVASTSNTNTKNNIVANFTYQLILKKGYPTTFNLTYQGMTGRPYSWVFKGDANGDGFTNNDLFYVPTGPDDPKVRFDSATERDAFFKFINSTSLGGYKGQVVPRNSATSPWAQTFNLSITQEIPIYKKLRAELYCNFVNFANLFNKKWGIQYEVPFSYKRAVAGATYDAKANGGKGQYVYYFNSNTLDGVPAAAEDISNSASRWQLILGARIKF